MLATACAHSAPPSRDIHFNSGKDEPRAANEYMALGRVIEKMESDPKLRVLLIGHTDSVGTDKSNRDLAFRRAARIQQLLTEENPGLESRTRTAYHGESKPVASNDTKEGRALNRRVEIYFYYPKRGQSDTIQLQQQFGGKLEFSAEAEIRIE